MEVFDEEIINKDTEKMTDSIYSEEMGHYFASTFPVVSNVLVYLNAKDLYRSARVCKLWSDVVKRLKARRRTKAWTTIIETVLEETMSKENIVAATRKFLNELYTEPKVIFLFCSSEYNESPVKIKIPSQDGSRREKTRKFTTYADFVTSLIPTDCQLISVSTAGIVGSSSDLTDIFECESDLGATLFCLPKYNGFSVIHNKLDESEDATDISNEKCLRFKTQSFGDCKAMLNFIAEPDVPRSYVHDLKKEFENAVIAGGMVDSLIPLDLDEGYQSAMQVALCGNGIDVGCVVLRETVNTRKKAEEKIQALKNYKLSEVNSFAFMFACVGRGVGMWGSKDMESSLFKKHFPKTPLFGFFGNGEIGMDHVSTEQQFKEENSESNSKKLKKNHKLFHSYTTIFVLVSIR